MTEVVLDASAILAFLRREPGGEGVGSYLPGGQLSAVNYAEILSKADELGVDMDAARAVVTDLGVECVAFDDRHAAVVASLRPQTKHFGLSLADRACLALAKIAGLPVVTADRKWAKAPLDLEVRLIR